MPPFSNGIYSDLSVNQFVDISLAYTYNSHMKYLHRVLHTETDGNWQIVQEAERASFGPFHTIMPPITYCYHLGFRSPKHWPILQEGEVTGVFNWRSYSAASTDTELDSDTYSLLPPPVSTTWSHEVTANDAIRARLAEFHQVSGTLDSAASEWFASGAWGFVAALSRSLDVLGPLTDYWRECDESMAKALAIKLLSEQPPLSTPTGSNISSDDIITSLTEIQLNDMSNSAEEPLEISVAEYIFLSAVRLSKLGSPAHLVPNLNKPTRFFISSNISCSPYQIEHHHALLFLSLNRCIAFVWNWQISEQAFQMMDSASIASDLSSFVAECFNCNGETASSTSSAP